MLIAKILISGKNLKGFKRFRSEVIYKNPKIARAADKTSEQRELYNELKETHGSITASKLGRVLGSLKYGTDDHFNRPEVRSIASAFGIKKMYRPKKDSNISNINEESEHLDETETNNEQPPQEINTDKEIHYKTGTINSLHIPINHKDNEDQDKNDISVNKNIWNQLLQKRKN